MKNIFETSTSEELINRINKLTPPSQPLWGSMSVSKMLAHCNVTYELVYENIHPKPKGLMKFILKTFVKNNVVSDIPFKRNQRTAPVFLIANERDFITERTRLIDHINKTQQFGEEYFTNRESHSFGVLNRNEWNNMFYKHLDHHLTQFGV